MKKLIFILLFLITLFSYSQVIDVKKFAQKHDLNGEIYGMNEGYSFSDTYAIKDYGNYSSFCYDTYKGSSAITYRYVFNKNYYNTYSKIISSDDTKTLHIIKNDEIKRALLNGYELTEKGDGHTILTRGIKNYIVYDPKFFTNSGTMYVQTVKLNKTSFYDELDFIGEMYNNDLATGNF